MTQTPRTKISKKSLLSSGGFYFLAGLLFLVACSGKSVTSHVDRSILIRNNVAIGTQLIRPFESKLKMKTADIEVNSYLHQLGQTLSDATPELQGLPVKVVLIEGLQLKWKSYSLPGNRIYLPIEMVRTLEYENELAAAIAIQLGHLLNGNLVNHLKETIHVRSDTVDFYGPSGMFAYSLEEEIDAVSAAVDILYRAGYDSRGLISLLNHYITNPNRVGYEAESLEKYMEVARRGIALTAPLRNPIVRSHKFVLVQKRIQQL